MTDRQTDICNCRVTFATEKALSMPKLTDSADRIRSA